MVDGFDMPAGSTSLLRFGEKYWLARRGRRAERARKGSPGTWEILSSPYVKHPGTGEPGDQPTRPEPPNVRRSSGAKVRTSDGTVAPKEDEAKPEGRQEVLASQ